MAKKKLTITRKPKKVLTMKKRIIPTVRPQREMRVKNTA